MERKFRLQKVLEYRGRILEKEKEKLAEHFQKERSLQAQLVQLDEELALKNSQREEVLARAEFAMAQMFDVYIRKVEGMRATMVRMIESHKKQLEAQREKTMKARNDVKIMEKLKEKHVENYVQYLRKEELKLIDELNVTRRGDDNA